MITKTGFKNASIVSISKPLPYIPSSGSTSNLSGSTETPSVKCRSRKVFNDWIIDWWGLELIAWLTSTASVLAIFAMLRMYNGQPLPTWPYFITLNSLLQVFATIGQMAMMSPVVECISQLKWIWFIRKSQRLTEFDAFDDASRGPTGSLILLGKLRGMYLVSLGAVITIVAISFGPVSQQAVSFPLRWRPSDVANATLSRATFFNAAESVASLDGISVALSAALQSGFARKKISLSAVMPDCYTANCTWDIYSSLGVCGNTVDISSTLINNTCNATALEANFEVMGMANPGYPCFNYSLPRPAGNRVPVGKSPAGYVAAIQWENATLTNVNKPVAVGSVDMMALSLSTSSYNDYSLLDINVIYQPGLEHSINSTLPPPIALESSLHLCIQTFNTTVINSVTTTTLVSHELLNTTLIKDSTGNATSFFNGSTFGVTKDALQFFQNYLSPKLSDYCSFVVNGTEKWNYCYSQAAGAFLQSFKYESDPLTAAKAVTENMAISLTNSFRIGGGGDVETDALQGIAYSSVTFVEADYIWLTLPAGLILLTLIFLLTTISQTRRLGAKNWKSSNFATLQGLDRSLHDRLGGLVSTSDMEEKMDEVKVELLEMGGEKEGGWRLVQTN